MSIAKPKLAFTKLEIPNNDTNDMGTHPFHQSNASKLQRDVSGKKINLRVPDPGNNIQGIGSCTKVRKDLS